MRPACHSVALALLAAAATGRHAPAQDAGADGAVLRDVRVTTRDVYTAEQADGNAFYSLLNAFHRPTDPEVVRRELWFAPGDRVTPELVAEVERNLRAMRLFAEVDAVLEETGDGRQDLRIDTRDRFSLVLSGGVSFVGGTTNYDFAFGEVNLLGTGKRVLASASREDTDRTWQLAYEDRQLFGTWHRLGIAVGDSDEGAFGGFVLERPLKHLADPTGYGIELTSVEQDVDYWSRGDTVASVPRQRTDARASVEHAFGPAALRGRIGSDVRFQRSELEPATGVRAPTTRVPGDTSELQLGVSVGVDAVDGYREVKGLDAIDWVEDLTLGTSWTLRGAAVLRDEDGSGPSAGTRVRPRVEATLRSAVEPFAETWLTAELGAGARLDRGEPAEWSTSLALHAFQCSLPAQTLALSLTHESVGDHEDLAPQLTLGEDSGLRGYPAREFAGTRIARLNVEDRVRTGLEVLSVHIGAAAFYDVGWVHSRADGLSQSDAIQSAGVGLRLGSSALLASRVVRVDVAWPLDEVLGESWDVSVSAALGQVFGFFGNSRELRSEFGTMPR